MIGLVLAGQHVDVGDDLVVGADQVQDLLLDPLHVVLHGELDGASLGAFSVRVTPGIRSSMTFVPRLTSMPSISITASPASDRDLGGQRSRPAASCRRS